MLNRDKQLIEKLVSKYGKNALNEALRGNDSIIMDMLRMFANSTSGVQAALYNQKMRDADSVDIVPLSEVFTEDEIKYIKRVVRPKAKMCYKNAFELMDYFSNSDHDIKYVEGYLNMRGLPIEHAFNMVDGKYVDCTIELALGRDVTEDTYVKIGEFDIDTVREILLQNEFYGQIYETIFLNNYRER